MVRVQDGCWNCRYNHEDRCVFQMVMELGQEGKDYWRCCISTVPMGICEDWRRNVFFS